MWPGPVKLTPLFLLVSLAGGCSHAARPVTPSNNDPDLPFALRGQDTLIALDFGKNSTRPQSYVLQDDELCYLTLGNAIIVCSMQGSYLLFGPGDGVFLIKDNPMYHLRPLSRNPTDTQAMRTFGILFLIAGSANRLPDAFVEYLNDPGPHRLAAGRRRPGKSLPTMEPSFQARAWRDVQTVAQAHRVGTRKISRGPSD